MLRGLSFFPGVVMNPEEIRQRLQTQPFQPFRIYLSDGRSYDIRHPEMVFVTRQTLIVGIVNPAQPGALFETYAAVSTLHITAVEPIFVPKPATTN
jgi:hypothetical protein